MEERHIARTEPTMQSGLEDGDRLSLASNMKNAKLLALTIVTALCLLASCTRAQPRREGGTPAAAEQKVLIVYLSRTNNTKAVAELIHETVGGTLVAIEPERPYPVDYQATVQQVTRENETGYLPPLKTRVDRIEQYDVIFLGFPTWGMQLPPPVRSFLKQHDLSGKTVIPFNTHAGYGVGSGFREVKQLSLKGSVLEGLSIKGGIERDGVLFVMGGEKEEQAKTEVRSWLERIGLTVRR